MTTMRPVNVLSMVLLMLVVYVLYQYVDQLIVLIAHTHRETIFYPIANNLSMLVKPKFWTLFSLIGLLTSGYTRFCTGANDFPLWARRLLFFCLSVLLVSVWVTLSKFLIGRVRPEVWMATAEYGFHFMGLEWGESSMPSGHTATAFAVASSLAMLFRRWRFPLYLGAVILGLCRIVAVRHYPSDVIVGAYLGLAASWFVYSVYDWEIFFQKAPSVRTHKV